MPTPARSPELELKLQRLIESSDPTVARDLLGLEVVAIWAYDPAEVERIANMVAAGNRDFIDREPFATGAIPKEIMIIAKLEGPREKSVAVFHDDDDLWSEIRLIGVY